MLFRSNDTATTEIYTDYYTLSLHDALPISAHADFLATCDIVATGTTGGLIAMANPKLRVRALKSGPLGGDQQIGALIAEGLVDAMIFLVDPLTPMPHDVDVKALMRLAVLYDIPMALNIATAQMMLDIHEARRAC